MLLGMIQKAPLEVLDYDTNCVEWLGEGDFLTSVDATVDGSTVVVDSALVSATSIKVRLRGGADGDNGKLTLLGHTNLGLTKEVCYRLRVKDC